MKRFLTILVTISLLLTCTIPANIVFAEDAFVEVSSPEEFIAQVNLGADIRLTDDIKLGEWNPMPFSIIIIINLAQNFLINNIFQ